jgi:flavin reductase (DIM6/NTAB) family NADH-FMN oxidoreductase RutF/rubredoxin
MDTKAFRSLSYGMYLISSGDEEGRAGCIVNTFAQVTSKPARASVAVNKENATADVIRRTGRYAASVLGESAPMELIGRFGFRSSADFDKFGPTVYAVDSFGLPTVTEHAVACFTVKVIETIDAGSHWLFLGEVEDARVLRDETPMTYAYYHLVKGGKTPPKASSYVADEAPAPQAAQADKSAAEDAPAPASDAAAEAAPETADDPAAGKPGTSTWKCLLCGYEVTVEGDELPADFTCPMCGAGRDMFERVK